MTKTIHPLKKLTEEQLKQYEEQGFVIVRNVLSSDKVEQYKKRAREFALGDIPPGAEKMVIQDVRVAKGELKPADPELGLWKHMNPDKYDPLFAAYPSQPELLDVVEDLIGPDLMAFLVMFIYKPPMLDLVHPYHQDAYYFKFAPHDDCLGTWLPLDRVDAENGTLSVIPGSHKLDLLPHVEYPGNYALFGVTGYEDHPEQVSLELDPGDAVFFHSRLLHTTGANKTADRQRRVMTVHYASSRCRPTDDNPYQPIQFRLVRGKRFDGCI